MTLYHNIKYMQDGTSSPIYCFQLSAFDIASTTASITGPSPLDSAVCIGTAAISNGSWTSVCTDMYFRWQTCRNVINQIKLSLYGDIWRCTAHEDWILSKIDASYKRKIQQARDEHTLITKLICSKLTWLTLASPLVDSRLSHDQAFTAQNLACVKYSLMMHEEVRTFHKLCDIRCHWLLP